MTQTAARAQTRAAPTSAAPRGGIDDLALASLLSSRICHDLVGPIGAINNGVEFLEGRVDAESRDGAMGVIEEGALQAKARLQFYRAAFGLGGSMGETARLSELRNLTVDYLQHGRVSLDWRPEDETIPRPHMRLLLNLILIAVETLPRGGLLRVGVVRKGATTLLAMAEGPTLKFGDRLKALIETGDIAPGDAPLDPKEAPALLTHRLALACGADLSIGRDGDRIVVAATV